MIVAIFLPLLAPVLSLAYCTPLATLEEHVGLCEENYHFVRAADQCVEKLNTEVKLATRRLEAGFTQNDGRNQSLDFRSSGTDYNLSSKTLAHLIVSAESALADVQSYYPVVVEQDDQEALPAGAEDTIPCYFRTRASIMHVSSVLQAKIANLKSAKAIADAHHSTNGSRELNHSVMGAATAKATRGQGSSARTPAGRGSGSGSDITGTHEAREKTKQSSRALGNK